MAVIKFVALGLGILILVAFIALILLSNRAEEQRHWGFIDERGTVVVPIRYDDARDFSGGFAAVKRGNDWGFVNLQGMEAISPRYQQVGDFSVSGRAWVEIDNATGYIDVTGSWVIEPKFDRAYRYSESLAIAGLSVGYQFSKIGGSTGHPIYAFGLIDQNGQWIVPPVEKEDDPQRWSTGGEFSEGLCPVQVGGDFFGYIDTTGKFVIPPVYTRAGAFRDGYAVVGLPDGGNDIINTQGETILTIPVNSVVRGEDRYFTVYASIGDEEGAHLVNIDGTVVLGPFDEAGIFAWTRIPVKRDGKWVLLDLDGAEHGDTWDHLDSINAGFAAVRRNGRRLFADDSKEGFIDSDGALVIPPTYNRTGPFSEGRARVAERISER